jgi:hypothetical protein
VRKRILEPHYLRTENGRKGRRPRGVRFVAHTVTAEALCLAPAKWSAVDGSVAGLPPGLPPTTRSNSLPAQSGLFLGVCITKPHARALAVALTAAEATVGACAWKTNVGGGGGGRRSSRISWSRWSSFGSVRVAGRSCTRRSEEVGAGGSRGNEWQDAAWKVAGGVPAPAARHAHGSPKVVAAHSRTR